MKSVVEVTAALRECQRHADILSEARSAIADTKLTPESAQDLQSELLAHLDQSACRFGKLQDTMGLRVLPQKASQ